MNEDAPIWNGACFGLSRLYSTDVNLYYGPKVRTQGFSIWHHMRAEEGRVTQVHTGRFFQLSYQVFYCKVHVKECFNLVVVQGSKHAHQTLLHLKMLQRLALNSIHIPCRENLYQSMEATIADLSVLWLVCWPKSFITLSHQLRASM